MILTPSLQKLKKKRLYFEMCWFTSARIEEMLAFIWMGI